MKKSYEHLNQVNYRRNKYDYNLLYRSTSPYIWKNQLQVTFMLYLQSIIMTAARRIKYLVNYQNPINRNIENL